MSLLSVIESRGAKPARLTVVEALALMAAMPECEAFELIDGEIVPMAAAKHNPHEHVKGLLTYWLARHLPDDQTLNVEPWLMLDDFNASEPDLVVYPERLLPLDVRGPEVTLLIEVADTSLLYDRREKARRYASYGVRDYWVVDTTRKQTWVHRDPDDGGYASVTAVRRGGVLTPLLMPDLTLRLDDLKWRTEIFNAD